MQGCPIRCVVVDDQHLFRAGLASLFAQFADVSLVGEARTGAEGIALVERRFPSVVLMDLHLPDMSGTEATQAILEFAPRRSSAC